MFFIPNSHKYIFNVYIKIFSDSLKYNFHLDWTHQAEGGPPPGYFLPDDILDRVAVLLDSFGEGLTVRLGGDADPQNIGDGDRSVETSYIVPVDNSISQMLLIDSPLLLKNPSTSMDYTSAATEYPVSMGNEVPGNGIGDEFVMMGKINTLIVPKEKRSFRTSGNVLLLHNSMRNFVC